MEDKNAVLTPPIGYDSPVVNFYSGKSVFITGCTGFLGAVLLEKLLFTCGHNINKIYVLIKHNDDQTIHQRVSSLLASPAFKRIRGSNPHFMEKIKPICGDLLKKAVGLTENDIITLQNEKLMYNTILCQTGSDCDRCWSYLLTLYSPREVSVVFHCAADTSFEMTLKEAVNVNTKATEEMLKICKHMHQLIAFVYVSTAYSNCNSFVIDEKVYLAEVPVKTVYELLKYSKDDLINYLLNGRPNAYTYSKALSEDLIQNYSDTVPSVIVRPSISNAQFVISSVKDPIPGWLNGWNGLNGVVYSGMRGYLRCWYGDPSYIVDATPVDYIANILIVSAWEAHVRRLKNDKNLKVYNYCSGVQNPISSGSLMSIILPFHEKRETDKRKVNKTFIFLKNYYLYFILFFFLHILPAIILDIWNLISGKHIVIFQNLKKINRLRTLVNHFCQNEFLFVDNNVRNLFQSLNEDDKRLFDFDVKNIQWKEYLENYVIGMKKFNSKN